MVDNSRIINLDSTRWDRINHKVIKEILGGLYSAECPDDCGNCPYLWCSGERAAEALSILPREEVERYNGEFLPQACRVAHSRLKPRPEMQEDQTAYPI